MSWLMEEVVVATEDVEGDTEATEAAVPRKINSYATILMSSFQHLAWRVGTRSKIFGSKKSIRRIYLKGKHHTLLKRARRKKLHP